MKGQPLILRRIRLAAAICAGLPLLLLAVLLGQRSSSPAAETSAQLALVTDQLAQPVGAEGEAIRARMAGVEDQVLLLQAYAADVLKSPDIYGGPPSRTSVITGGAPGGTQLAASAKGKGEGKKTDAASSVPTAPSSLPAPGFDNPMLYTKGSDGAIRKLIDDGRPAVFFRARGAAGFSVPDKQRLLATAALDPLLKKIATGPLAGRAFLLTADSLLRTAPFRDMTGIPGSRDLTLTPLYAWKADKADKRGIVWTAPYPSPLSGKWVIAALAGVQVGGRLAAVVGAEVPAKALEDNALSFPLGTDAVSWLQQRDGVLLAAPPSSQTQLGVPPLADVKVPAQDEEGRKMLDASNLYLKGNAALAKPLAKMQSGDLATVAVTLAGKQRYLVSAPLDGTTLRVGALLSSPLAEALKQQQHQRTGAAGHMLVALLISLAFAAVLVLVLSTLTARRITVPLGVLTQRVRDVAAGRKVPVATAGEGEVGQLSRAVQELVDRLPD